MRNNLREKGVCFFTIPGQAVVGKAQELKAGTGKQAFGDGILGHARKRGFATLAVCLI